MNKEEIRKKLSELRTKENLLDLLNDIVKDELGEDAFSFSLNQLNYFSNPNNVKGRYRHFSIPKKSGGERRISAPQKGLMHILTYVNIMLKAVYKPSDNAMGFVEGRNVVDNASIHIGQNYIYNIDLENFFPSIEEKRVWKRLQLSPFNINEKVAGVLSGLLCVREKDDSGKYIYVLPQGAPTSPLVTNAICDKLDRRLSGLARRFNLHYSRYADDITFSSMHNVYQNNGEFCKELLRIIEDQNFRINEKKRRLNKRGDRQEVTGLIVSNKVNVSKKYISEIRNILHIWEKYGYSEAFKRFYPYYLIHQGKVQCGEPIMENVLLGKLQYLKMVKGTQDSVYSSLQERYNRLTSPLNPNPNAKYDYLKAFSYEEFCQIIDGSIEFFHSKNGNLFGKAIIKGNPVRISVAKGAKSKLLKNGLIEETRMPEDEKSLALIMSKEPGGSEIFVILTTKQGGRPFWLITCQDPTSTELDRSDVSASELIDIWEKKGIDAAIEAYEDGISLIDTKAPKKYRLNGLTIVDSGDSILITDELLQEILENEGVSNAATKMLGVNKDQSVLNEKRNKSDSQND